MWLSCGIKNGIKKNPSGNLLVQLPSGFDDVVDINMELQAGTHDVEKPLTTFLTKFFDDDADGVDALTM